MKEVIIAILVMTVIFMALIISGQKKIMLSLSNQIIQNKGK